MGTLLKARARASPPRLERRRTRWTSSQILRTIRRQANPAAVRGMLAFGITAKKAYGLSTPQHRAIARSVGPNHRLAQELWNTGIFDARCVGYLIAEPKKVSTGLMDRWVQDFDSWAICDGCCQELFSKTPHAYSKIWEWSLRDEEFVKRAAFALIAKLAFHDRSAADRTFRDLLGLILRESTDERLYVRKGVNWALREIGKRNRPMNRAAIKTALRIQALDTRASRWIAADALRELRGFPVQRRLMSRSTPKGTARRATEPSSRRINR